MSRLPRPGRPLALCRTRGPLAPPRPRTLLAMAAALLLLGLTALGLAHTRLDTAAESFLPRPTRRRGPPNGWPARSAGPGWWSCWRPPALER